MSKLKKALEKAKAAREQEQDTLGQEDEQGYEKVIAARRRGKDPGKEEAAEAKAQDTTAQKVKPEAQSPVQPVASVKEKELIRTEINPAYSQTRTASVDPIFLKKNSKKFRT